MSVDTQPNHTSLLDTKPSAKRRLAPLKLPGILVALAAGVVASLSLTPLADWTSLSTPAAAAVGAVAVLMGLAGVVWLGACLYQLYMPPIAASTDDNELIDGLADCLVEVLESLSEERLTGLYKLLGGDIESVSRENLEIEIVTLLRHAAIEDPVPYSQALRQRVSGLLDLIDSDLQLSNAG